MFGSDLPAEGKGGARFEWRDGPFLNALKKGDWIVLDEVSPKFWYKKIRILKFYLLEILEKISLLLLF